MRMLRSGSLKEWLTRASDLAAAGNRGEQLKVALDRSLAELGQEQSSRQSDLLRLQGLEEQQQADLATLDQLRAEQEETSQLLAQAIAETRQELRTVDTQQPALADRVSLELDQEVQRIIDLADQQVWRQVGLRTQNGPAESAPVEPASQTTQGHSTRYRFIWPMPEGQITQGFGPSSLPFEPPFAGYASFHTGMDIAGRFGARVLAAGAGRVVLAATSASGYGNYVVLDHGDGVTTLYGHLDRILVRQGDRVNQGDAVGLEGSTGYSTGPHVHFEVRVNGIPVDPAAYLPPGPPSPYRA
jgi:murein DD-endopeptidase MepM/ murein hydrolase activator NlpD